ncbi:MAG: pre-peptidase C-terminal domain-containing protein [Candidatus Hydrogenedentes bacterium]|nr:pre-peptidase C-terminal domain-containing protein [Candidatus Hydrogenedentota bacterium]
MNPYSYSSGRKGIFVCFLILFLTIGKMSQAQLSPERIEELRQRAKNEGWSFEVGETTATRRPLESLTGFIPPPKDVVAKKMRAIEPVKSLPARWDWREQISVGLPEVRDQGECGSCWAFVTVGVLEGAIAWKDGVLQDLSEQWLVDCVVDGNHKGCSNGWYAFEWFEGTKKDPCGGYGAVLETDYPYTATDYEDCSCPKPHYYFIDDWGYITEEYYTDINLIKTAIYNYGPVACTMSTIDSFQAYAGGIYDDSESNNYEINHGVVLVGWDDNFLGTGTGVFIVRNSWGTDWGEGGYAYIKYGIARIGSYTAKIVYRKTEPGSLKVTIQPSEVVSAGAQWRVDGGSWQDSGVVVSGLSVGSHTVEFNYVNGWTKPGNQVVSISSGQTTEITVVYIRLVIRDLVDGIAVTDIYGSGSRNKYYRIDVPNGQESLLIKMWGGSGNCDLYVKYGSVPRLDSWDYRPYLDGNDEEVVVEYPSAGWWYIMLNASSPYSGVSLVADYTSASTQTGSLRVSIEPSEAVSAGAQWRVDGGNWQSSGAVVSGLSVGSHTVEFKDIIDWIEPESQVVSISAGQTIEIEVVYEEEKDIEDDDTEGGICGCNWGKDLGDSDAWMKNLLDFVLVGMLLVIVSGMHRRL